MKKILFSILSVAILLAACDKVEAPYIEQKTSGGDEEQCDTGFVKKVLVEDYTAHYCTNCPRAATVLEDLKENVFKCQVVGLAVHVGLLAQPGPAPYDLDLRTQEGTELDNFFGLSNSGLPKGMVNRTQYNGDVKVGDGDWPSAVNEILQNHPEPEIGIKFTAGIDTNNHKINISTDTYILKNLDANLKLCVVLFEDNIKGAQKDQNAEGGEVTDYTFMHVYRMAINNTWGDDLASGSLQAGEKYSKSYTEVSYSDTFVSENLGLVIYVYDDNTKEIIQVEDYKFFE